MKITVVIPTHNPEIVFFGRLSHAVKMLPDWEFVVVDDASRYSVAKFVDTSENLTVVRNKTSYGAGAARNIGLSRASGDFVVFWDDDDIMHWAVVQDLVARLQADATIDFAVSQYDMFFDGRQRPAFLRDSRTFDDLSGPTPRTDPDEIRRLSRLTNYPWNKVFRRVFLERIGLRFSETYVQNDVFAHWKVFLHARSVLVSSRVQCTKVQDSKGNRVGDADDMRTLESFVALRETYEMIAASGDKMWEGEFWAFFKDLVNWRLSKASPRLRPLIWREYAVFSAMLPGNLPRRNGMEKLERWRIFDMNQEIVEEILGTSLNPGDNQAGASTPELDLELYLAEVCRLRRLAHELKKENSLLRVSSDSAEAQGREYKRRLDAMQRELNSKTVRWGIQFRTVFRKVF